MEFIIGSEYMCADKWVMVYVYIQYYTVGGLMDDGNYRHLVIIQISSRNISLIFGLGWTINRFKSIYL